MYIRNKSWKFKSKRNNCSEWNHKHEKKKHTHFPCLPLYRRPRCYSPHINKPPPKKSRDNLRRECSAEQPCVAWLYAAWPARRCSDAVRWWYVLINCYITANNFDWDCWLYCYCYAYVFPYFFIFFLEFLPILFLVATVIISNIFACFCFSYFCLLYFFCLMLMLALLL